jgi:RNA polymerase sigma factor (sigma-70 family)
MNTVIRHLRRAALLQEGCGPTDEHLLELFLARRDEAAFEALMRRHGPMVLGVCRRVLRNAHDAEDAFQATFLVFVRKAGSLRSRELLANWLYGVAYRTAMKARAMNAKRRAKERQAAQTIHPAREAAEELLAQLDHELSRLPDKYRAPLILCELEGKSRKDAAQLLDLPEGTLSWRLAQAKKMLARKLSRYGTAALAALLSESAASACLTHPLRASTLKVALMTGAVPAKVLALTEGVMKAMLLTKLKIAICVTALALGAGVGATGLTYKAMAEQPTLAIRPQGDELEALRLEIEALRKSLQATRERVKTLEGEVSALKGQLHDPQVILPPIPAALVDEQIDNSPTVIKLLAEAEQHKESMEKIRQAWHNAEAHPKYQESEQKLKKVEAELAAERKRLRPVIVRKLQEPMPGQVVGLGRGAGGPRQSGGSSARRQMKLEVTADPVADAEAALKKLRANPGDKQATEALERALKRLKERDKLNLPGEETPP